jgi:SAM-dependent methyltransferase
VTVGCASSFGLSNAAANPSVFAAMVNDSFPLPPADLRWGGARYQDDAAYLDSALGVAGRLVEDCGLSPASSVLDIGCGQARLLRGLLGTIGVIRSYLGADVHRPSIEWAQRYLRLPYASFRLIDFPNARYNPHGHTPSLPDMGMFDCVVLISVFSHMHLDDISLYLRFIKRSLAPGGSVYLTAFVEDNVPLETENPGGYVAPSSGPLHRVRLNRQHFEQLIVQAGLGVKIFRYAAHDAQSAYRLVHAENDVRSASF